MISEGAALNVGSQYGCRLAILLDKVNALSSVTERLQPDTPGAGITILAAIALLTIGYFVFRHAMRRPSV